MSKQAQLKQSTFSAGREAYLSAKKEFYLHGKNLQNKPTFVQWITDQQKKRNPFEKASGLRKVWDAGWVAGLKGLRSNKNKKMLLKQDLSRIRWQA